MLSPEFRAYYQYRLRYRMATREVFADTFDWVAVADPHDRWKEEIIQG
jgi:hypothetical protein